MTEYKTDRCSGSFLLDPCGDLENTQIGPYVYLQTNATYLRPGRPQLAGMLEAYAKHLREQHAALEAKLANDPTRFTRDDAPSGAIWSALEVRGAECLDVRVSLLTSSADRAMCESYGKADEASGGSAFALTPEQSEYRVALYKRIDRHVDWDRVRCECSLCRPKDNGGLRHL